LPPTYAVEDQGRVYGRGFTLYGTLPEIDVWRGWPIPRAAGEFDMVVFADIWALLGAMGAAALAAVSSSTGSLVARRPPLR